MLGLRNRLGYCLLRAGLFALQHFYPMKLRRTVQSWTDSGRAFSRTDLVIVIAALALLALLQTSSVAESRGRSHTAACLLNLRILATAWTRYADDHGGTLVGNLDGGDVSVLANSNRTWVLGWLESGLCR